MPTSLIEEVGPDQTVAVFQLLEVIVKRVGPAEEPLSEDRDAVAASLEYFRQNAEGGVSFKEIGVSLGMVASLRSLLPFRPARSF